MVWYENIHRIGIIKEDLGLWFHKNDRFEYRIATYDSMGNRDVIPGHFTSLNGVGAIERAKEIVEIVERKTSHGCTLDEEIINGELGKGRKLEVNEILERQEKDRFRKMKIFKKERMAQQSSGNDIPGGNSMHSRR